MLGNFVGNKVNFKVFASGWRLRVIFKKYCILVLVLRGTNTDPRVYTAPEEF